MANRSWVRDVVRDAPSIMDRVEKLGFNWNIITSEHIGIDRGNANRWKDADPSPMPVEVLRLAASYMAKALPDRKVESARALVGHVTAALDCEIVSSEPVPDVPFDLAVDQWRTAQGETAAIVARVSSLCSEMGRDWSPSERAQVAAAMEREARLARVVSAHLGTGQVGLFGGK